MLRLLLERGPVHFLEDGLPKGLTRDGPGIDTDTADEAASLNHSSTLPELGRLHGCSLPGWAASDAEEVVLKVCHWIAYM
jgi:hypothetical protein